MAFNSVVKEATQILELSPTRQELKCEIKPMDFVILKIPVFDHIGPLMIYYEMYPRCEGDTLVMVSRDLQKFEDDFRCSWYNKSQMVAQPTWFIELASSCKPNFDKRKWYIDNLFVKIQSSSGCTIALHSVFLQEEAFTLRREKAK
jgi:hypothetical protein